MPYEKYMKNVTMWQFSHRDLEPTLFVLILAETTTN